MTTNTNAALTEDQWLGLADLHANADWNCEKPDGFLNAVKALCADFAALTTAAAAVLPEGWVMVPVEPTEEMIIAGVDASLRVADAWLGDDDSKNPHVARWFAMLAAAPKAEPVPAAPRTALWSDAQEIYDEMTARMPSWDGRGSSRVGAVALALTVVADRAMRAQAAPQQEPVAWRHSKTLCLYDTKAEVPLADGDEWAEPLYLASPQPAVQQGDATRAAARALSDRVAEMCNVDKEDHWKYHSDDVLSDAELVISTYLAAQAQEKAPNSWDDLPKKLMEAARHDALTQADRVAIGRAIVRVQSAAPVAQGDALTQAARDVLAERQRQISAEGWTPANDDGHEPGSLSEAAGCYAMQAYGSKQLPALWPWAIAWWKPSDDPRRNLEKAGALILAEMERIDRAAARSQAKEGA